jgi:hypothetical protein
LGYGFYLGMAAAAAMDRIFHCVNEIGKKKAIK